MDAFNRTEAPYPVTDIVSMFRAAGRGSAAGILPHRLHRKIRGGALDRGKLYRVPRIQQPQGADGGRGRIHVPVSHIWN